MVRVNSVSEAMKALGMNGRPESWSEPSSTFLGLPPLPKHVGPRTRHESAPDDRQIPTAIIDKLPESSGLFARVVLGHIEK